MNQQAIIKRTFVILLLFFFTGTVVSFGHSLQYDFNEMTRSDIFLTYLKLGFTHILPLGLDHILFVVCIFLLSPNLKKVIWQATAFTVAHSLTLGLAMYGWIHAPSDIIEPVIALSIVLVAIENIITKKLHPWRIFIIFLFGLVHGLGFAGVLVDLGLPEREFITGLLSFNIGVELGQITIILIAYLLIGKWFGEKTWYRKSIVYPASFIIAFIALYWTVERVTSTING